MVTPMRTDDPLTETSPAPLPDRHASRAGMNFATFDTPAAAEALKSFLNRNGIDAHVQDERKLQLFWFLARPGADLHVRVPEPEFARAEELLHGDRDSAPLHPPDPDRAGGRVAWVHAARTFW